MKTNSLERLYYSIPELQMRWNVSENDIRHEIVNGRLVPSFFAQVGDFENMVNWQGYEREQAVAAGKLREWEDECGLTIEDVADMHKSLLVGPHYLHGIGNQSGFDCTFDQFSSSRNIEPAEEPAVYLFPHGQSMTLSMVVADGVVMAEEVARYEALVGDRLTSSDAKLTPAPLSQSRPLGKVWTDERKEEVRQYRAKHGLKKTAEHYGVSQALISKHVPAGRPQKAQQSFWQGLKK